MSEDEKRPPAPPAQDQARKSEERSNFGIGDSVRVNENIQRVTNWTKPEKPPTKK